MSRAQFRLVAVASMASAVLLATGSRVAAQEIVAPASLEAALHAPLTPDTGRFQSQLARPAPIQAAITRQPAALVPLYVSFGAMQVLDIHSTRLALAGAGREGNPLMKGVVGSPMAMLALKAGTTTGIIYLTQKVRKRHPRAAVALMVALNSAYAIVVSRNYSIARR